MKKSTVESPSAVVGLGPMAAVAASYSNWWAVLCQPAPQLPNQVGGRIMRRQEDGKNVSH
jgi:hypothetical protein